MNISRHRRNRKGMPGGDAVPKRMTNMNLRKKINLTFIPLLLCLILLVSASYAWLTLSFAPEISSVDTNVGANGSLEIALLSDKTYVDPVSIGTTIGDSAVAQDTLESNLSWGNVIELKDERYGLGQLSLLPARLNLSAGTDGIHTVNNNMLKVADFGRDGRISILSDDTVSATFEGRAFTYYVANQRYGVRAIGTISNLTAQQTALAGARTAAQSYTAAAARTVKNIWRENGGSVMDIFHQHYGKGQVELTKVQVQTVQDTAMQVQNALEYVDLALRQGVIGLGASEIKDGPDFETFCAMVNNTGLPLSGILDSAGVEVPGDFSSQAKQLDEMKMNVLSVIVGCNTLSGSATWNQMEPLLDILVDAEKMYLGEYLLSDEAAFENAFDGSVLTLDPSSGIMAKMAEYAGNYSTFFQWQQVGNLEARTADPLEMPHLVQVVNMLKSCTAATGGWTRANLDDTYGMAMDMAFRCNTDSDLLLQTVPTMRVEEAGEFPVTQGGGSYMRFDSEDMDTEQLLRLMDTIRIGFLDDRYNLIGLAKLNVSSYEEQEEGVFAPLYLYEYMLEENGSLSVVERRKEDARILSLSRNVPSVVTVVLWLDGDHVDNSMVAHSSSKSMSGVLNLQFSSSADLNPLKVTLKG